MDIRKDDFPVALQAYDVRGDHEDFLAEQVVASQAEADRFMSMYSGRLIKTREIRPVETRHYATTAPATARRRAGGSAFWVVLLLVIAVLLIVGFATGWIQTMIGQAK
ncbi:MAG TPA: hypothetical protein VGC95_10580 [Chitinophagaceae bacterium]|jgi:hypothetical protein